MSNCGLNDIFDINNCSIAFNNCRTAESIQIYLWQRIKEIQIFLNNFNSSQQELNNDHNTRITNNSNVISNIRNEIETLKALANQLSTDMTSTKADVNNFKLKVDETLRLYQTSIDEIVKNINLLRSDNQAISNRVNVLESQTDLSKLQEIIKTWTEIKSQFSAELAASKTELESLLDSRLNDFSLDVNKQLSEFNLLIAKHLEIINSLSVSVHQNSSDIETLDNKIDENLKLADNNLNALYSKVTKEYIAYVDKEIESLNNSLSTAIKNLSMADFERYSDLYKKISELEIQVSDSIKQLNNYLDLTNERIAENREEASKQYLDLNTQINSILKNIIDIQDDYKTALDFSSKALDYAKSASEGVGLATGQVSKFIEDYNYKFAHLNESVEYIHAYLISHVFKSDETGCYDVGIGVLNLDEKTLFSKNCKFNVEGMLVDTVTLNAELDYQIIFALENETLNCYEFIAIKTDDGLMIRVKQHINEFDKVYLKPTLINDCQSETVIDIDIHPTPAPVEPEPCQAIKVVLVDENCDPYRPKDGKDGRDGRDGRNGDGVEDLDIKVYDGGSE